MGWDTKRKWPQDAIHKLDVRATPEQYTKWHEAALVYNGEADEVWLVSAGNFFAWWTLRQRDLYNAANEQLEAEAREFALTEQT